MKTLLILEDKDLSTELIASLKKMGMSVIHYRDPVKALDNLPELDPDAVIMSAVDFPRHWKPIAAAIRSVKDRNSCIIVLLKGPYFSYDEAAKAALLEINGVIQADLQKHETIEKLLAVIDRYYHCGTCIEKTSSSLIDFACTHPETGNLVVGTVSSIDNDTIEIIPDYPPLAETFKAGDLLANAYIQVEQTIQPLVCSIKQAGVPLILSVNLDDSTTKELITKAQQLVKA
ncbi:MAG TPA: response regulator [Spirochaetia bacterium]|nr:response regulator [Spirochaetales bacterium]HRS64573.1 response regulator [Spirochaetia bacterium]HOT60589.1 response regulator [Spirochaetales bacterium]HPD80170.1 response regulator [Spirochaetales bacterium]HQK34983.1 response regulator [Spirochaetales bacterium]